MTSLCSISFQKTFDFRRWFSTGGWSRGSREALDTYGGSRVRVWGRISCLDVRTTGVGVKPGSRRAVILRAYVIQVQLEIVKEKSTGTVTDISQKIDAKCACICGLHSISAKSLESSSVGFWNRKIMVMIGSIQSLDINL